MRGKLDLQLLQCFLSIAIVATPCLLFVFPSGRVQQTNDPHILKYEVTRAASARITQTIQIENPTYQEIVGGRLLVPLIMNDTSRHYAILYDRTSTAGDFTTFNDSYGNMYICWDNLTIRHGQNYEATLNYFVFSFGVHYRIDSGLIGDYDKHSDLYTKYIQPENLVQSDSPEIVSKAQSLTQGIMDIHDKVSKIYGFVTSHMHYSHEEQERGALWALKNRTGDCSEYSYLFVALCRAAGIPARLNVGFGFRPSEENTTDGHMWTEYYLQNYGWVPVDPTWNIFEGTDEKHFVTMKSVPEVMPYANYFLNFTSEPNSAEVKHSQQITLLNSPNDTFENDLLRDVLAALKTEENARYAITIGKFSGVPLFFRTDATRLDETLAASELNMQNALETWQTQPLTAHEHILEAQSQAAEAMRKAWTLVSYAFVIFIGTLIAILAAASLMLRQRSKSAKQDSLHPSNTVNRQYQILLHFEDAKSCSAETI
ncbi:MAG TPA: transglutaminase-like domain-containing protein [Patescibacteria group bacterium]|nr:transglutaminase-like domain-containing protein [Patescibacteria group bacterium]